MLDLVCLLDLDGYADTIDAGLDEYPLVLVTGNGQGRQENFRGGLRLNLGDIVSFGGLGCEVGQAEGSCQTAPHCL